MIPPCNNSAARERYYSQLFLIYYLVWRSRPKASRYSIGRKIENLPFFNDVFLKLHREQCCFMYLFDIEYRRYKGNNVPGYGSLNETPSMIAFNLLSYFKSYLRVKSGSRSMDYKFIVWTNSVTGSDRFEHNLVFKRNRHPHCLQNLLNFDKTEVIKYQIIYNSNIGKEMLKLVHPLWELARKISRLIFRKVTIRPKTFPQKFYDVLLRDVFENESFREDFLQEAPTLCTEAKIFRGYLEEILRRKYSRRNLDNFMLPRIKQEQFAKHIKICLTCKTHIDHPEDTSWKVKCPATDEDVKQFLKRLVFCIPTQSKIDKIAYSELIRFYKKGIWLHSTEINLIFEMIELKRLKESRIMQDICFNPKQMVSLESTLRNFCSQATRTLFVEACADLNVTVDRVQQLLDECNLSTNVMMLNGTQYRRNMNRLSRILYILGPKMEHKLILIVADEAPNKAYVRLKQLHEKRCSIIFVVPQIPSNLVAESINFYDHFNFNDLSSRTMQLMMSKIVLLQGRDIQMKSLLHGQYYPGISPQALLDWRNSERIVIATKQYPNIPDNFINRVIQDQSGNLINIFDGNLSNVVVLCGPPGMGKTVLLSNWCNYLFERNRDCLIILKDAKEVVDSFCDAENDCNTVIKLLELNQPDGIQRFIVEKLVKEGRICLLVDGFDEISAASRQHSDAMLRFFNNASFRLIVVATRPERLMQLEHKLNDPMICNMQPLSEEDQSSLLKVNSSKFLSNKNETTDLLCTFKQMFNDANGTKSVFWTPLQSAIIACIIDESGPSTDSPTIAEMLQLFIDKTFEMYTHKYFDPANRAHEIAVKILRATFETEHAELAFNIETNRVVPSNQLADLQPFGLIRQEHGRITFFHTTFSEYFLVMYLLTHYVEQDYFNKILGERLCKANTNWFDKFLNHHIQRIDPQWKLIGTAPTNLSDFDDLKNSNDYRLQLHKTKQFHLYLKTKCTDKQVYDYLRLTLSRAELNVFEVIFDSLPVALARRLQFKFVSCDQNSALIDLSTTSEDGLVLMMKVFARKQAANAIELIMTNANEPDFVENAIEKNYVRVIEQLFEFEKSITNEEASDQLFEYYHDRWRKYLQLAVLQVRTEILEHLNRGMAKRFHQKMIKHFMMKENFLREFIIVSLDAKESAAEVVQMLVDIVRHYLSDNDIRILTNRAYDGENCSGLIERVRNQQIRDRFEPFQ